jgi:hypothetical protein
MNPILCFTLALKFMKISGLSFDFRHDEERARGLDHRLFDGILDNHNLVSESLQFASSPTSSNDGTGDITGTIECILRGDEDVQNILAYNVSEHSITKKIIMNHVTCLIAEERRGRFRQAINYAYCRSFSSNPGG